MNSNNDMWLPVQATGIIILIALTLVFSPWMDWSAALLLLIALLILGVRVYKKNRRIAGRIALFWITLALFATIASYIIGYFFPIDRGYYYPEVPSPEYVD